jgi:chemotaxis family two-component system sensor kinase Cph1
MVYRFDDDGHGEIIAEARESRLEPLLGQRYPATDIPQRARGLYLRNRVRVLADAGYTPSAVLPRVLPHTGEEFDMSMCHLRSMSPLHIQYLKNMGVTATLVVSLVREGRLWGLIACHHYSARHIHYTERAAVDLLAEVVATRIAAIENYVRTQVDVLVRSLELRLIEATSTEGDWRLALVRNPAHPAASRSKRQVLRCFTRANCSPSAMCLRPLNCAASRTGSVPKSGRGSSVAFRSSAPILNSNR